MLTPSGLLAHADRQLDADPDEADCRRSISAMYYAVFNMLTSSAAALLVRSDEAGSHGVIRRSFDHRTVRRVCEGLLGVGKARPKLLDELLPSALPPALIRVAVAFVELQAFRLKADYDLDATVSLAAAKGCQTLAHAALQDWTAIRPDPAAHAFLVALHLADRLTRRG